MHIIALENHVTSQRGGQELNLLEICRGLFDRGHSVTLLYLKDGDLLPCYESFCDRLIQISAYGFDWHQLESTMQFIPSLLQLRQIPVSNDSLIFCNDYHFSLFATLLSYFRRLPYVCYLQLPPLNLNRQRKFGLQNVDRFVAVSEQTKRDWVEFGIAPNRICVVYNGVDLNKFKPVENLTEARSRWRIDDLKVVSYIGRIDQEKGLETLIKATAILIDQGLKIQTIVAGKPVQNKENYLRSLEALAARLGVGDSVQFVGHLSNPVSLYQASDVNVLPSIWNEPCSLGLFESLACGVPKIATRIGGNPEILTEEFAKNLFEPGDETELADRLIQVINWRETDPQFGDRCRQHVLKYFTYEKMVDGIEKNLLEVLR